jgi:hypothetical protein
VVVGSVVAEVPVAPVAPRIAVSMSPALGLGPEVLLSSTEGFAWVVEGLLLEPWVRESFAVLMWLLRRRGVPDQRRVNPFL